MAIEAGGVPGTNDHQGETLHPTDGSQTTDTPSAPEGASLDTAPPPFHKVVSLRRPPPADGDVRSAAVKERLNLLSGLMADGRRGGSFDVRLVSDGTNNELLVQGGAFGRPRPADTDETYPLPTPAAAQAVSTSADEVEAKTEGMVWKRITGDIRPWQAHGNPEAPTHLSLPVKQVLSGLSGRLAVIAQGSAVTPEEIKKLAKDAGTNMHRALLRGEDEPDQVDEALIFTNQQQIYKGAQNAGALYDARFAVGAPTPEAADDLARNVEAALHDMGTPVVYRTISTPYESSSDALADPTVPRFLVDAAAVSRSLPIPDEEIAGVPIDRDPAFSLNTESDKIPPERRMVVGRMMDGNTVTNKAVEEDFNRTTSHELEVGASENGKTTRMQHKLGEMLRIDHEQRQLPGHENDIPLGIVAMTPKADERFEALAAYAHKYGRDFVLINVGGKAALDQVPVGIDPAARMPGELPKQAEARVLNTTVAASGTKDPDVTRAVVQYGGEGAKGSQYGGKKIPSLYAQGGIDRHLGTPEHPNSDRPNPTYHDFIGKTIVDTKGHGFTHGAEKLPEFMGSMLGMVGQAAEDFINGEQVDPDLVRGKVIGINFNGVTEDPIALSVMELTWAKYITAILKEEETVRGKPTGPRMVLAVDEVNKMAPKGSAADDEFGDIARESRSLGLAGVFAVQEISETPSAITGNTKLTVALGTENPEDAAMAAGKLGIPSDKADHIAMLARLPQGQAIVKGPHARDPVRVQLAPPPELPTDLPKPLGPEALVRADGRELYTLRERREADIFAETIEGYIAQNWAETEVKMELLALDPAPPADSYLRSVNAPYFDNMRNAPNPRVVACAIEKLVTASVSDRGSFIDQDPVRTRKDTIAKVTKRILFHLDNGDPNNKQELPEELNPGPALQAFSYVSELATAHNYLASNEILIQNKIAVEQDIAANEQRASEGEDVQADLDEMRAFAQDNDATLADYDALQYDPATGTITPNPDHVAYSIIDKADSELSGKSFPDFLVPPQKSKGNDGFIIDRSLGISIFKDAVMGGKREAWAHKYADTLRMYDLPHGTADMLLQAHLKIIDANIAKYNSTQPGTEGSPEMPSIEESIASIDESNAMIVAATQSLNESLDDIHERVQRMTNIVYGTNPDEDELPDESDPQYATALIKKSEKILKDLSSVAELDVLNDERLSALRSQLGDINERIQRLKNAG